MALVNARQTINTMEIICALNPVLEGFVGTHRNEGFEVRDAFESRAQVLGAAPGDLLLEDVEDGDDVAQAGADVDVAEGEGDEQDFEVGGGGGEGEEDGEDVVDARVGVDYDAGLGGHGCDVFSLRRLEDKRGMGRVRIDRCWIIDGLRCGIKC